MSENQNGSGPAPANPPTGGEVKAGEGTQQGTAPKEGEAPKGVEKVVPEKYDLKPPKDTLLQPADLEKIVAYAKAQGFSQEEAQKLLERDHGNLASYAERQKAEFDEERTKWKSASVADKEIGGENTPKAVEFAKRALKRFASPELIDALNETGFGDHPELIRVFYRVGKEMANDSTVLGGGAPGKPKSAADVLYPTMGTK